MCQLFIIEWETATDHGIQNDPAGPDIDLLTAIGLATDDFWGGIVG